ncbi:MAG: TonB-dependent siderophore receptor [Burkholderiaceae bacterium]
MNKTSIRRQALAHGVWLAALVSLTTPSLAQTASPTDASGTTRSGEPGNAPASAASAAGDGSLAPVEVQARRDAQALPPTAPGGLSSTGTRLGILGNTDIMDTPMTVNTYTRQTIQDFQARTVGDLLQGDPSVWQTTNEGHMFEHFMVRGLNVAGDDFAFNGLYGLAPSGHIPTEYVERIEVLRGPNALLAGMPPTGAVGGMINMVPKRAGAKPITDLTLSYSSKSYMQGHIDVGRRFGEEKRLGVRFNGAYGSGETGVAEQEKGRRFGSIALDYAGNDWSLSFDAYNSREKIRDGSPAMYSFTRLGHLLSPPDSDTNLFRGTHGAYRNHGWATRGEYRFNPDWVAYAAAGASKAAGRGLMFGTRTVVLNDAGDAQGFVYNVTTLSENKTFETGIEGNFATGPVKHRLNAALSYLEHKEGTNNRAITGYPQNIYDPVAPVFPDAPADPDYTVVNRYRSLAIVDTIDPLDGKLLLMLGVRFQQVEQRKANYDESKASPSLGIVLKPWNKDTSIYANYMEGLSAGETVGVGFANTGQSFAPLKSKQMEAGVKLRRGGATHTLNVFQIERPTIITDAASNTRIEGGKQRVRGAEWSVLGTVVPTLSVFGGVSIFDAKQVNTGLDSFSVPEWTARLGLQWATPVPGLALNGRIVHVGKQWLDSANTLRLPSWSRFDVGAKYSTRIGGTPVTFNAFIENLANKRYWYGPFNDGFAMQGMPRTFRLAATMSF